MASHHNKYVANKILFATKSQMDINVGQIEELTKLLDAEFEVNARSSHPILSLSLSLRTKGVCVCA